ncbi:Arc family DNA-binding protein [Comamonas thiooxydans]|uniref:Arc family DNA-binding protein n=1 Tax=Comamonas thiooxydans TaxID=363952 RepID=UPI00351A4573
MLQRKAMNEPTTKSRSSAADKYVLRFHEDGLRGELKVRAAHNQRSLNAEILFLIKRGLEAEGAHREKQA